MKKLSYILSALTLFIVCWIDVASGNTLFTGIVVLCMAFVAFGCMTVEAVDKILRED